MKKLVFCISVAVIFFACNSNNEQASKTNAVSLADSTYIFGRYKNLNLTGNPNKGHTLYNVNGCGACHSLTDRKITAVGLARVLDRVPKPTETWLVRFIRQANALYTSGDPYVKTLFANTASGMPYYTNLSEQDAKDIIAYIATQTK